MAEQTTVHTVEELHKAIADYNLRRLDQIRNTIIEKLEEVKKLNTDDIDRKKEELTQLENLVSSEDNALKKKVLEEKVESLKQALLIYEDKQNVNKLTNTLELVNRRFQEIQILGC